jgi:hypothetical protein
LESASHSDWTSILSNGRKQLNWRDLFMKYITIVEWNEGVHFLHQYQWSPEEWEEISKAIEEAPRGDGR